jgi:hypothetical protein
MKTLLALISLIPTLCFAQLTAQQTVTAATSAGWNTLGFGQLEVADVYFLAALNGAPTPQQTVTDSASWNALDDHQLQVSTAYLLSLLAANTNGTFTNSSYMLATNGTSVNQTADLRNGQPSTMQTAGGDYDWTSFSGELRLSNYVNLVWYEFNDPFRAGSLTDAGASHWNFSPSTGDTWFDGVASGNGSGLSNVVALTATTATTANAVASGVTNWVLSQTNGLVGTGITNGLAGTNWVGSNFVLNTNNIARTNVTQTFHSPLTLATKLTVLSDNAIYVGAGKTMQFNGATAPSYDYYSGDMRVNIPTGTTTWSLHDENDTRVLQYFPVLKYLYASNAIGTMEYYGKGHALDALPVNPQAIARLLPKPYVQITLADWDGGTYVTTQTLYTNTVQQIKTNGFMLVMTNMGITPIIDLDETWMGTNRVTVGGYLTNDTVNFPSNVPYLANYAHTNGCRFGLSIYYYTNNIPGQTKTISVNYGSHFQEVVITADSVQKDVFWMYQMGVDSLRIQDVDGGYTMHNAAELARSFGTYALAPNNYAWDYNNRNDTALTNQRPLALTALMGGLPPPGELWPGVNMVSWDGGWPITPTVNMRNSTGTRWLFTNMVPNTSVGHYFEVHFVADGANAAENRHYLSQIAMMNQGLQIENRNSSPPFGGATFQAFIQNTNMLSIHQDVGGVPEFKIRRIYDGGTGQTMAFAKTLTGQNRAAVWLINDTAGNVNMGVTMEQLGLDSAYTYSVTNVWNNTNGGSYYLGFTNLVQANDSALFILDRVTAAPFSVLSGVASSSKNLLAPTAITVGSTPFIFTNSVTSGVPGTNNIYVFIDGAGVTGTVGVNGTTIFSALVGANVTIPLQPNETVTVTYSVGTPVMKWKPF